MKHIPLLDGLRIDQAHKGGGKGVPSAKTLIDNPMEYFGVMHDPGGLLYKAKNKDLAKFQSQADWANIGANPSYQESLIPEKIAKQYAESRAADDKARSDRQTSTKKTSSLSLLKDEEDKLL